MFIGYCSRDSSRSVYYIRCTIYLILSSHLDQDVVKGENCKDCIPKMYLLMDIIISTTQVKRTDSHSQR